MWSRIKGLRHKGLLWRVGLLSIVWLWGGGAVYAITTVTISGTIRAVPSCVLNNNLPINVSFGDAVGIENINGKNFKQQVTFSISCKNMIANTVKLQIEGSAASFNSDVLGTQVPGLGLEFLLGGSPVSVNQWFSVNYLNLPLLEVVPVMSPNANLQSGKFNGSASLLVSYL